MVIKNQSGYEERADPKDFAPDFEERKEPYGEPVREVLDVLRDELEPQSNILDIAGGYGRYAIPLIRDGHSVEIVDIHDASLVEAAHRAAQIPGGEELLKISNSDIIRQDDLFNPNEYNAAICIGFMHHLTPEGGERVFKSMVDATGINGLILVEYSCDKDRRLPSGERILVDGDDEQNMTLEQGRAYLKQLASVNNLEEINMPVRHLQIRDNDFWYDTNMIIFYARKK